MRFRTPAPRLVALAALALAAGCDTDNGGSIRDLEGTYAFTQLRFDPAAPAVAEADVLDRLDENNTDVRIFTDGDVLFLLEFDDLTSFRADAMATASRSSVRIQAVAQDDVQNLERLLIPSVISLSRGADDRTLTGQINYSADLARYDPQSYGGLQPVPGTLYVTLERQ